MLENNVSNMIVVEAGNGAADSEEYGML